ncbi:50S ribosomal protein L10 [Chloroflexota bacterium]
MTTREKNRGKKMKMIDSFQEILASCNIGILTDYRGLTTAEMNELRHKLDEANIKYQVVKNTLARFAAERAGRNDLAGLFEGPIAVAFSYGELTEPAKALADYIRTSKSTMSIKGGFLSDRLLTTSDVEKLSKLPSRDILLAKMLGSMKSPIVNLVGCLSNPLRGMVGVLQARINQLEEA